MGFGGWLAGGALLASITAAWGYIRWILGYLMNTIVVSEHLNGEASYLLLVYLQDRQFKHPLRRRSISAAHKQMLFGGLRWQYFELVTANSSGNIYRWRNSLLFCGACAGDGTYMPRTYYYLRWTLDFDALLCEAAREADRRAQEPIVLGCSRFQIKTLSGTYFSGGAFQRGQRVEWNSDNSKPTTTLDTPMSLGGYVTHDEQMITCDRREIGVSRVNSLDLASLVLTEELSRFVDIARQWIGSVEWYRARNIPWKLGARLIGSPGTGKTSYVRALALELDVPIFILDLATMTNNDLREKWQTAVEAAPAIVLLEDFDSVFDGRQCLVPDLPLTFDPLLQCISGAEESNGILLMITTNKPEKLDSALTRAGRAEFELKFNTLTAKSARKIAERILVDWPEAIDSVLSEYPDWSGAEIQKACIAYALERRTHEMRINSLVAEVTDE